jgi:hypothetical protein
VANLRTDAIRIAGRTLEPSPVFDTYWRFAAARQDMYLRRLDGSPAPWTDDPILREHRFTNAFRAADRVSQFLIRDVIYGDDTPQESDDVIFRILLFKAFNKVTTWQELERQVGPVSWKHYSFETYLHALDRTAQSGPIYSPAYVIPPPQLGGSTKRENHLRLIEHIMRDGITSVVEGARSLAPVYERLCSYPSIGPFLAFQFTIDLNYSEVMDAGEDAFVIAGPGARDGIRKCFGRSAHGIESEVIHYMAAAQEQHFERLGLHFGGLFGRPLQLIDCQNVFCEVDKYARVAHPDTPGISGRTRIKQKYRPQNDPLTAFFPPRWGLPSTAEPPGVGRLFA